MEPDDRNAPAREASGTLWLLLLCSLVAIAAATAMCAGLLARRSPTWQVVAAGLAVFPLLPLLWHGLAEVGAGQRMFTGRSRFALRTLTVALLVLGISLGNLGPQQVVRNLRELAGRIRMKPAEPPPAPKLVTSHGLESFIPADATLVVGLAGSGAVEELLAAHGVDTRDKLAALATCKIDFTNARILVAARGRATQMIVMRAPGLADERNLYCLVGVMGSDRLQIHGDGMPASKRLLVSGLLSRTHTFRLLDDSTVIAADEAWQDTIDQKLYAAATAVTQGRLAQPLLRVDRTAPLWAASVDETPQGTWDLALDTRQDGATFVLQGSATPPSGAGDRAEIAVRVPLAFARALPESAVALGVRGVVAAVLATSGGQVPVKSPPPLPSPPAPTAPSPGPR
jgi:hypothetical protein